MRGIFFDEDSARAVAGQLISDGWEATVSREPLAGEDDDEGHQWAVVTDAPQFKFEILIDSHDGWLEFDDDREQLGQPPLPPLDLPSAPKRIKRPD